MDSKPVIILGTGGHAKVLLEILRMQNTRVLGVTNAESEKNMTWNGLDVLGNDEVVTEYSNNEIELVNGIGKMPDSDLRKSIKNNFLKKGYSFRSLVHSSAIIATDVYLGHGVQIMAGVVIQPGVRIEDSVIINSGSIIDHDCCIESDSHIATGVSLSGNVKVGKNVHIGTGSNVIQNINIGNNVTIAAGSSVFRNIEDNMTYLQKKTEELILKDNSC